ncbi:a-factor receptor [Puccinia graminis f. sp. tritici]|uniref:A-factor receptor n=1 Tax=Puccinia graminis f. sp. tritici TaxID=56615 RepID=A0A5B0PUA6_PUCGR|nr:a-factor receptor [Puccinia graminis f. sp. tritici]
MASGALINTYLSLSLLCGLLNIPPTILHISQGHSGPASFGLWATTLNILAFTNGVIWRNDALDRAPVLCDISSKISEVGPLGLLIANCCIIRYLALILTPNRTIEEPQQKRRRILLDYCLSLGFPSLIAAVSVIYQVGRYQINNLAGCSSASALVWPTFILSIVWPLVFCGISCCYSLYVLYCLIQRHRDIKKLVNCTGSTLNVSRFARMGALSVTYFCVATPCAVYGTLETIAATGPYVPWVSWSTVHNEDNKLSMVRQYPLYQYQLRDWLPIVAGLMVICFFSCGSESVSMYSKVGLACLDRLDAVKEKIFATRSPRRNHEPRSVFSDVITSSSAEKLHTRKLINSGLFPSTTAPQTSLRPFHIHVSVVEDSVQAEY